MGKEHLSNVDALLAEIAGAIAALGSATDAANKELEAAKARHAGIIAKRKKAVENLEKRLDRLVRSHRAEILGDGDRADFANGSVMLKDEKRVKRIKGMLERLKAEKLTSAVRTLKEAVDWDRVEKFSDAMLAQLGTERVLKTVFSYELKPIDAKPIKD